MNKIILLLLLSFMLPKCSSKPETAIDKDKVTIGTFNIAWLGDGNNDRLDRTENDYKAISDIIRDTGADILALEEVENAGALNRIIKYLPGYSFLISQVKSGSQNVGVLFRKELKVGFIEDYMPLAVEAGRNRPGLVISVKKGNFDWIMMIVHLKSTSRYDETAQDKENSRDTRELQAELISHWADSVINSGKEKDIIIAGDFNDSPKRKKNNTLISLLNNTSLTFLTSELRSCKFKSMYVIDQIMASGQAMKRFNTHSERVYDFFSSMTKDQASRISDHCPVMASFEIKSADND